MHLETSLRTARHFRPSVVSDISAGLCDSTLMKMMRRILGDRSSAIAVAVLAAYLLLLQGFVGGMTRSAMAASAADPLHAICITDGIAVELPHDGGAPAGKAADCPCASLCRLAANPLPAIVSGTAPLDLQDIEVAAAEPLAEPGPTLPPLRGFLPEPRAPPSVS